MAQVDARPPLAALAKSLLLLTLLGASAALAPGCGTSAQAIDVCQRIEEERCRQAPACGSRFAVKSEDDVLACIRFYRDQCMHGTLTADPGGPVLDACVNTIQRAGACALAGHASLADCSPQVTASATTAKDPCDVVQFPESTQECSFLNPAPLVVPEAGVDADADAADEAASDASTDGD